MADELNVEQEYVTMRPEETREQRVIRVSAQLAERNSLAKAEQEAIRMKQESEKTPLGYAADVASGVNRGILGAVDETAHAFGDLAGFFGADLVDEYAHKVDLRGAANEIGVAVQPTTVAGGIAEGIAQFTTGFLPVVRGARAVTGVRQIGYGQVVAGSALVDATVFDPHEARLADFVQSFPAMANPVTEYMASDEDHTVAGGRLRNMAEGLVVGTALDGLLYGLRYLKAGRKTKQLNDLMESVKDDTTLIDEGQGREAAVRDPEPKPPVRESDVFGEKLQVRETGVTLESLKRDDNAVDSAKVESIREAMRRGDDVPEILVRREEDGSLTVVDGHHRLEAIKREGIDTADVFRIADQEE